MPIPIDPSNITEVIGFLEKGDLPNLGKLLDWKGAGGNDFSIQDLTSDQFKQLHTSIITWGGENIGKAKGLLGKLIAENESLQKKLEVIDENTTLGQFIKANLPVGEPDSPKSKRKNEDPQNPASTATLTSEQAEAVRQHIASLAPNKTEAQTYLNKFKGQLPPLKLGELNDGRLRATLATEIQNLPEALRAQLMDAFNEIGDQPAKKRKFIGEVHSTISAANEQLKTQIQLEAAPLSASTTQPPAPPPGPPSSTTSPPQPIGTEQPKLVKPNDQQLQAAIEAMKKKKEQAPSTSQPPAPSVPPTSSTQKQSTGSDDTTDEEELEQTDEEDATLSSGSEDDEELDQTEEDATFSSEAENDEQFVVEAFTGISKNSDINADSIGRLLAEEDLAEALDEVEVQELKDGIEGKSNFPNLQKVLNAFETYQDNPSATGAKEKLRQSLIELQQQLQQQHQAAPNPQATKLTSLTSNLSQLSQQNSNDDGPKPLSFKGKGETPKTTLKGQSVVQTKEPKPPEDFKKLVDAVIKEMKLKKGDYTRSATSFEVPSKDITMQRRNDGCVCTELPNDLAKLKEVFPAILKAHQSAKMTNFELNGPKENVEFMADTCLKQKPPIKPNISKEYLEEHGYKSSEQFIQDRLKAMKGEPSAGKDKTQKVEQTSEKPKGPR